MLNTTTNTSASVRQHNLPVEITPFLGRRDELGTLAELLSAPNTRLITILAPGGMGKSRLALEASRMQSERYTDGVFFVPLAPLLNASEIVTTIAENIGLSFYGENSSTQQLIDFLRERSVLLVLDNFEHLLDATALITEILQSAPKVKILITSRERLNLIEEWILELNGLDCPVSETDAHLEAYSAVQLFVQSAQRIHSSFTLTDIRKPAVSRICRLVGGMPLGIELAAAWVRVLPCEQLADEIERSLEILETSARNMPLRHRSMRAVFVPTWERMSQIERDAFMKLSIFRGGFTRQAADQVAGASLQILSSLADKSLLRMDVNERYELHELLRQYGEEQLTQSGNIDPTRNGHSAYYTDFCEQREPDIKGYRQLEALNEIEADFENVRVAWLWAVEQNNRDAINRTLESLFLYCEMRSRFYEGDALFRRAGVRFTPDVGEEPHRVWGKVLARLVFGRQEDIKRLHERREQALAIAQRFDDRAEIAYCLWRLAEFSNGCGNYADALPFLEQSLVHYRDASNQFYIAKVLNEFGISYRGMGQLEKALYFQQQSLDLRREIHDYHGVGWCLHDMGQVFYRMEHYAEAELSLQEADTLWRKLNQRFGVRATGEILAYLALLRGEFRLARIFAEGALEIAHDLQMWSDKASALTVLGALASIEGDYTTGRQLCEQSLAMEIAPDLRPFIQWGLAIALCGLEDYQAAKQFMLEILSAVHVFGVDRILTCLPITALLLAQEGQKEWATELLGLVFNYPNNAVGWLNKCPLFTHLRADLETQLGAQVYRTAWKRGKTSNLDDVIPLVMELFQNERKPRLMASQFDNRTQVEALSTRELDVLRLIALGLSNPEIAERLSVGESTVKKHINHLYSKLDVQNRTQAVLRAQAWKLV